jgi:hypothetical protein
MTPQFSRARGERLFIALLLLVVLVASEIRTAAQARGAAPPTGNPATAKSTAPRDFTGYWMSMVTEDWRWRMAVPIKGDFNSVPLNAEGRRVASVWDPAQESKPEEQCKGYGAATIMRVAGRLHIDWQDANMLKIETDSGTQTKLLHFGGSPSASESPQWQGYSVASWEGLPLRQGRPSDLPAGPPKGYMKVVTTHMLPGYLRKNGVPYSSSAVVEEYFDRISEPGGDTWLLVTTIVTDPQYLTQPFVTHGIFKKIPDGAGWDPTPCRADEAR